MDSNKLARQFIDYFCKADIDSIESLLADRFILKGPLFEFSSRQEYIDSLVDNLEADPKAVTLSVVSDGNEAAAFFIYNGNTIGQLFRCEAGKIVETILVFDTQRVT